MYIWTLRRQRKNGLLPVWPIKDYVAAVSVGLVHGRPYLDLDYALDVEADVDLNVVMTGSGRYVEVQGNAVEGDAARWAFDAAWKRQT